MTTQSATADDRLIVRDFTLTHGIAGREPMDKVATYGRHAEQAYAFARINNTGSPTQVRFQWYFNGQHHATVPLTVGSSQAWRTWSSANLSPGDWRVQLVDSSGVVLMTRAFTVGGSGASQGMVQRDNQTKPMARRSSPMEDVKPASGRSPQDSGSKPNQSYPSFGSSRFPN